MGFHGGVVGVAGPLHDNIGRDTHGKGVADEGALAGMGAENCVFGFSLLDALAILIVDLGDGR